MKVKSILLCVIISLFVFTLLFPITVEATELPIEEVFNIRDIINRALDMTASGEDPQELITPSLILSFLFQCLISILFGISVSLIISIKIVCKQRNAPVYIDNIVNDDPHYTIKTKAVCTEQNKRPLS